VITGRTIDYVGRRAWWAVLGTTLVLPSFLMFALSNVTPAFPMVLLGFSYCICAAALW
jgi:hypothetical protein